MELFEREIGISNWPLNMDVVALRFHEGGAEGFKSINFLADNSESNYHSKNGYRHWGKCGAACRVM